MQVNADMAPALITIGAFAMVLGIVIVTNIANYHTRKLRSEERLTAIAKGIPLPPELETDYAAMARSTGGAPSARGLRTGGIVLVSVGIGLSIFGLLLTWIVQEHQVLVVAAAGLIPLTIGIGLLVDYALRVKTARPEGN